MLKPTAVCGRMGPLYNCLTVGAGLTLPCTPAHKTQNEGTLNSGSICRAQSKIFLKLWMGKCCNVSGPGILVLRNVSTDEVRFVTFLAPTGSGDKVLVFL